MLAKERLGRAHGHSGHSFTQLALDHQNNLECISPSRRSFLIVPSNAVQQLLPGGNKFFLKSGAYRSQNVGIFLQKCTTALSDRISTCRQCINMLIFPGREGSGGFV